MNFLRLVVSGFWTLLWGMARWLKYMRTLRGWGCRRQWAFMWGQCESPKAVRCQECGWAGPLRWAIHTYQAAGWDDVEPVDRCPYCHADDLSPAFWRGNGVWMS
jgi:hypothetical protein